MEKEMIVKILLSLFALIGFVIGGALYGKSLISQIRAGMFAGFGLGCVLIIIFM